MSTFNIEHKILLTGTPIQNSLTEIFNLLHFLELKEAETIQQKLEDKEEDSLKQLEKLKELLKPHILRRTKNEKSSIKLPPKVEILLPVGLSTIQREQYKDILERNFESLSLGTRKSFKNVFIQLRKCCNHPYLFEEAEPSSSSKQQELKLLIEASKKMELLDKLLNGLKEKGNKVLIFSQFTSTLDIIEDYLFLKQFKYNRVDGETEIHKRQQYINDFNDPLSESFIFLLSTRATRLG